MSSAGFHPKAIRSPLLAPKQSFPSRPGPPLQQVWEGARRRGRADQKEEGRLQTWPATRGDGLPTEEGLSPKEGLSSERWLVAVDAGHQGKGLHQTTAYGQNLAYPRCGLQNETAGRHLLTLAGDGPLVRLPAQTEGRLSCIGRFWHVSRGGPPRLTRDGLPM